ncbi:hypothetical protein J6TS7_20990 [Paenibacillus dendritiformis]|nr:hypothetical protein J6TS7_20990 [Paenibacillus dendritiformis]
MVTIAYDLKPDGTGEGILKEGYMMSIFSSNERINCKFCCEEFDPSSDDIDRYGEGFWCSCCDGYTFFEKAKENRNFTLILEGKASANETRTVSDQIKLNKRLSPLRYPGGKSKIADYILSHISSEKTDVLISPYTGGGSVEFALLHAGVFKRISLNDYDFGVYSLFQLIKTYPDSLSSAIKSHKPTHEDYMKAREIIKCDYANSDMFEAAWSLLVVNRLAFSGIYKANPLGGRKGDQVTMLSRWNPDDLCKRIAIIHSMRERFTVHNQDALEFIEEEYWNDEATIFIDPPYYGQGKNLYLHYYEEDDHLALQLLLDSLYKEFPCADLLVTYDDVPFIERIYEFPDIKRIKRKFSA